MKYHKDIEIYYNITKHVLSVRQKGLVIKHTPAAEIFDAQFVVQPAGREKVLREKRKNVHAFIRGTAGRLSKTLLTGWAEDDKLTGKWRRVTYNPYKYKSFIEVESGFPIYKAKHVVISGRKIYVLKYNDQYAKEELFNFELDSFV
jgi:hypothetical protein